MDNVEKYLRKALSTPFPFPQYTDEKLAKDFRSLQNSCADKLSFKNIGLTSVKHFHPSLWLANKDNRLSPYDAWHDVKSLIRVIENRLQYKGETLTAANIVSGFSISGIAPKVSIFKPYVAKYLIKKYLNRYDEIFDPCCGYSGRLLGAASLDKKYIGQDINMVTIKEAKNLVEYLKLDNISLRCKNSLATTGSYQCLFTCPPYGAKENWNQSIEELSADEWIEICLNNYNCRRYLFVVDKTDKYKDYIVEELTSKSHFTANTEYVICIDRTL